MGLCACVFYFSKIELYVLVFWRSCVNVIVIVCNVFFLCVNSEGVVFFEVEIIIIINMKVVFLNNTVLGYDIVFVCIVNLLEKK